MSENLSGMSPFDNIKKTTVKGIDYWLARELGPMLEYTTWDKFFNVIERAMLACKSSGTEPTHHFYQTGNMVQIGSGAMRDKEDWLLSRYACYLVAMNADASKPQVALAQTYFAIQTRRQEISDSKLLSNVEKRMELRDRVTLANKSLNSAAKESGVQSYALFHDAGYRGLYSMGLAGIKQRKKIPSKENLLDHAGQIELAANLFRATLTTDVLSKSTGRGEIQARDTHHRIGKSVRATIQKEGGTMPEDLPPEPSIKKLKSASKVKALPN